jgi:hypothetical protein
MPSTLQACTLCWIRSQHLCWIDTAKKLKVDLYSTPTILDTGQRGRTYLLAAGLVRSALHTGQQRTVNRTPIGVATD